MLRYPTKAQRHIAERARAIDQATSAGATSAYWGQGYDTNPHTGDAQLKLAWSQGHNGARARMAIDERNGVKSGPPQAHGTDTSSGGTMDRKDGESAERPLNRPDAPTKPFPFEHSDY